MHIVDSYMPLILINDTFIRASDDEFKGNINYFHKLYWISYKNYNFVLAT
jgi:hypothetical protein